MKKWGLGGGIIVAIIGGLLLLVVVIASLFGAVSDGCDPDSSGGSADLSGVAGEWTQPGTKANATAKAVFDYWTKKGMSGAQAAGIVGNIGGAEDKGFVLDQREFGGGSGGGLYQFTPYTKYLNDSKSDKSWSVENQGDVVISLEPQTVKNFFAKTKSSSPEDAATDWMNLYERPSPTARAMTNNDRRSAAAKAYQIFGGANISAKDSILGDAAGAANAGQAAAQSDQDSACSTNGGGVTDGTGKVPDEVKGKLYAANEIPDSLKQFLLPINLSDARGVPGESWAHPGGQCVDYSVSEAVALWNNTKSWSLGNGVDQVNSAIKFGYAVKDDAPHAGDIVSCDGTDPSIGHTWIVGHVFEDGSVLVQEQNFPGKSGDDMGTPKTWDVGVLPPWKGADSWKNVPNWGSTMGHATFAKPAHGMKTK